MASIHYEKVDISSRALKALKRDFDKAPKENKIGRWYAKRHYSQLNRERKQGYHWLYLSGPGAIHCTCGLVVTEAGSGAEEVYVPSELMLDSIQRVRGHRNLPSGCGETVALIVNFVMDWDVKDYLWDVFCQECSSFELKKLLLDARSFVKEHNRKCGTSLRRQRRLLKKVGEEMDSES